MATSCILSRLNLKTRGGEIVGCHRSETTLEILGEGGGGCGHQTGPAPPPLSLLGGLRPSNGPSTPPLSLLGGLRPSNGPSTPPLSLLGGLRPSNGPNTPPPLSLSPSPRDGYPQALSHRNCTRAPPAVLALEASTTALALNEGRMARRSCKLMRLQIYAPNSTVMAWSDYLHPISDPEPRGKPSRAVTLEAHDPADKW